MNKESEMGEVKRYDSYGYDGLSGLMKEHVDGDWVRSEDYDALRAENAELVAALRELVDDTQKLYAAGRVPALTWIRASNLAALDSTGGAR